MALWYFGGSRAVVLCASSPLPKLFSMVHLFHDKEPPNICKEDFPMMRLMSELLSVPRVHNFVAITWTQLHMRLKRLSPLRPSYLTVNGRFADSNIRRAEV